MSEERDKWKVSFAERITKAIETPVELLTHEGHKLGVVAPFPDVILEKIVVEGEYPGTEVLIYFRHAARPGCLFGYRWGPIPRFLREEEGDEPESLVGVILTNLEERLYAGGARLPKECDPSRVVWV